MGLNSTIAVLPMSEFSEQICFMSHCFMYIAMLCLSHKNLFIIYAKFQNARHYVNMPMQYTGIFHGCKIGNFQKNICDIFLIFAHNIDRGYTLEPPHCGGSNEYPGSMFESKT